MDIHIRPAEVKDAKGIAIVQTETWHAYAGQIPDEYLQALSVPEKITKWQEILSHPKGNAQTFVAEKDGQVVGFCSVGPRRDTVLPETTGELWAIYVDKNHMRGGVGSALWERGKTYLKENGYTLATLWVLMSNAKTRKWYESKGWRVEGKTLIDKKSSVELHEIRYIIDL